MGSAGQIAAFYVRLTLVRSSKLPVNAHCHDSCSAVEHRYQVFAVRSRCRRLGRLLSLRVLLLRGAEQRLQSFLHGFIVSTGRNTHDRHGTRGLRRFVQFLNHLHHQFEKLCALSGDQYRVGDAIDAQRQFSFERKIYRSIANNFVVIISLLFAAATSISILSLLESLVIGTEQVSISVLDCLYDRVCLGIINAD